jgi:hypothetical protein
MAGSKFTNFIRLPLIIAVLLFFCTTVLASCDCGYIDVQDPSANIWTTYWESNFTTMSSKDFNNKFRIMQYSVQHDGGDRRMFTLDDVAIDSSGLHLSVRPALSNGSILSGGIFTKRLAYYTPHHYPCT